MLLQRLIVGLLVGALGLPILLCVLFAVGRLLDGMQDAVGAAALSRIGLGFFVLWIVDLVGLVVVQAIQSAGRPNRPPDDSE
ncbi:MAG TPA: hypothetical protein VGY55_24695 [Pirellulales bacterium]|nr:hypothetical protein [Pirellulales bacterium]